MIQENPASSQDATESSNEVDAARVDPQWDCLYGLPHRCYLDFVGRFILQTQHKNSPDPFAVDLSAEFIEVTYIPRKPIIDDIRSPGTRLILGKAGIGKTAVFDSLLRHSDEPMLSVGLHLQGVSTRSLDSEILTGEASLLTPSLLIPHIFDTYWEKAICLAQRRAKYLPRLRADEQWMRLLRWFYQHYPPGHLEIDDHELMAWLRVPSQVGPLQSGLSPLRTLRQLVRLITWKASPHLFFGSRESLQVYTSVGILLDGTGQLSPTAIRRLIADAQILYDAYVDRFYFKLFIDSVWEHQVISMDCVRQGRVNVVNLPSWSDSELRELLRRRIYSFRSGGSTADLESMPEYDLGILLAESGSLKSGGGDELESLIIAGAQGTPLHALRLARCVVAACASCWPQEFAPPLSIDDVNRLVQLYHEEANISRRTRNVALDHAQ